MKREVAIIAEKIQERTNQLKTIEENPMSQTMLQTSQNKRRKEE